MVKAIWPIRKRKLTAACYWWKTIAPSAQRQRVARISAVPSWRFSSGCWGRTVRWSVVSICSMGEEGAFTRYGRWRDTPLKTGVVPFGIGMLTTGEHSPFRVRPRPLFLGYYFLVALGLAAGFASAVFSDACATCAEALAICSSTVFTACLVALVTCS